MIDLSNITKTDELQTNYLPVPEAHHLARKLKEADIEFELFAWNDPRSGYQILSLKEAQAELEPFIESGVHVTAPCAIEARVNKDELLKAALSLVTEPMDEDYKLLLASHARLLPGVFTLGDKPHAVCAPLFRGCNEYLPEHEDFVRQLVDAASSNKLISKIIEGEEEVFNKKGIAYVEQTLLGHAYEIASWLEGAADGARAEIYTEFFGASWCAVVSDEATGGFKELETSGIRVELERSGSAPLGFWIRAFQPDFFSPNSRLTGRDLRKDASHQEELEQWLDGKTNMSALELVARECLLNPALSSRAYVLKREYDDYGDYDCQLVFEAASANPLLERRIYLSNCDNLTMVEAKRGTFEEFNYSCIVGVMDGSERRPEAVSNKSIGPSDEMFSKVLRVGADDQRMKEALVRACPGVGEIALEALDRLRELCEAKWDWWHTEARDTSSIVTSCYGDYLIDLRGISREEGIAAMHLTDAEANLNLFEDLGVSERWTTRLEEAGIATVGDLIGKADDDLYAIEGVGTKALEEIRAGLEAHGLERVLPLGHGSEY